MNIRGVCDATAFLFYVWDGDGNEKLADRVIKRVNKLFRQRDRSENYVVPSRDEFHLLRWIRLRGVKSNQRQGKRLVRA